MNNIETWLDEAQARQALLDAETTLEDVNTCLIKDLPRALGIVKIALEMRKEMGFAQKFLASFDCEKNCDPGENYHDPMCSMESSFVDVIRKFDISCQEKSR